VRGEDTAQIGRSSPFHVSVSRVSHSSDRTHAVTELDLMLRRVIQSEEVSIECRAGQVIS
jgi:hypothetical protein